MVDKKVPGPARRLSVGVPHHLGAGAVEAGLGALHVMVHPSGLSLTKGISASGEVDPST